MAENALSRSNTGVFSSIQHYSFFSAHHAYMCSLLDSGEESSGMTDWRKLYHFFSVTSALFIWLHPFFSLPLCLCSQRCNKYFMFYLWNVISTLPRHSYVNTCNPVSSARDHTTTLKSSPSTVPPHSHGPISAPRNNWFYHRLSPCR